MSFDPKPGLVFRYDFLWKSQSDRGQIDGSKDRPCVVVLAIQPRADGSKTILVCPITHTPPGPNDSSVEGPPKVARHLKLDDTAPSWIKTNIVNVLDWPLNRLPAGISRATKTAWTFGELPQALGRQVFDQVAARAQMRALDQVRRLDADPPDGSHQSNPVAAGPVQPSRRPRRKD